MSVDTVFKPLGPTTLVGVTAVQVNTNLSAGISSYRIRNLLSTVQYFAWGPSTVGAPAAPTAGVPSPNTIGMLPNSVETFELPINIYFIAGSAAAFEVTPGMGQ
jgi:hypothetical protein